MTETRTLVVYLIDIAPGHHVERFPFRYLASHELPLGGEGGEGEALIWPFYRGKNDVDAKSPSVC